MPCEWLWEYARDVTALADWPSRPVNLSVRLSAYILEFRKQDQGRVCFGETCDRDRAFPHANMELCRRPGAPGGPAGCADGSAPSRLYCPASARLSGRAGKLARVHCHSR